MANRESILRQVMEHTNGRWTSMYDLVEKIAPRADVLEALRTISNQGEYRVRKRDPDQNEDDSMLREYRTFALGCPSCGEPLGHFHKPSCNHAGHLVDHGETREW